MTHPLDCPECGCSHAEFVMDPDGQGMLCTCMKCGYMWRVRRDDMDP